MKPSEIKEILDCNQSCLAAIKKLQDAIKARNEATGAALPGLAGLGLMAEHLRLSDNWLKSDAAKDKAPAKEEAAAKPEEAKPES